MKTLRAADFVLPCGWHNVLTVGSLFAGIGGFDLGFERSGFEVCWQAEQDGKAQSVLSARFPTARLYDDVRTIGAANLDPVDVICGGFPCQDVSVAGKREGLGGERTGLFWQVVRIAREVQPRWMVLENVPGLLSSHGGRDFHTVLSALAELGFRRAYRILDSRYFGVAQRRRRVFIVLRARRCGDGPAAVLFEPAGGDRDSEASGEARPDATGCAPGGTFPTLSVGSGGSAGHQYRQKGNEDALVAYTLRANERNTSQGPGNYVPAVAACLNPGHEAKHSYAGDGGTLNIVATLNSGGNSGGFRTEPGEHLVIPERARALVGSMFKRHDDDTDTLIPTFSASMGHHGHSSPRGDGCDPLVVPTLTGDGKRRPGGQPDDADGLQRDSSGGVRRLTPLECERLQGFPDGWTCLCGEGHRGSSFCTCGDFHRYRQLGNAVTVFVAAWIARRIALAEAGA